MFLHRVIFPLRKGEIYSNKFPMEQFIQRIRDYADAVGKPPQAVLRAAIDANWGQWDAWVSGQRSPTLKTADRVLKYIEANPVPNGRGV